MGSEGLWGRAELRCRTAPNALLRFKTRRKFDGSNGGWGIGTWLWMPPANFLRQALL